MLREKSKIHFKVIKRTMFVRQKPLAAPLDEKTFSAVSLGSLSYM